MQQRNYECIYNVCYKIKYLIKTEANKRNRGGKDDSRLTRNKLAETCGKTRTTGWRSATQHHSLDNWWLARLGATSSWSPLITSRQRQDF